MEKSEKVVSEVFCGKSALLGGILVFLVFFAAHAAAAPVSRARVNRTVLDPIASKPVWVSNDTATRSDPMLVQAMLGSTIAVGNMGSVIVPARPEPRSPFVPPQWVSPTLSLGGLPYWYVGNL
jgi:hypothetical protein